VYKTNRPGAADAPTGSHRHLLLLVEKLRHTSAIASVTAPRADGTLAVPWRWDSLGAAFGELGCSIAAELGGGALVGGGPVAAGCAAGVGSGVDDSRGGRARTRKITRATTRITPTVSHAIKCDGLPAAAAGGKGSEAVAGGKGSEAAAGSRGLGAAGAGGGGSGFGATLGG
jgi:hypothetical protein